MVLPVNYSVDLVGLQILSKSSLIKEKIKHSLEIYHLRQINVLCYIDYLSEIGKAQTTVANPTLD